MLIADLPVPTWSGDEVHRITDRVLSRAEFREPALSPIARARKWLLEQLGHLLARLLDGAQGSALGWVVVALLLAGVAYLVWRFARSLGRDPHVAVFGGERGRRRSADEWRAEADELAGRGEWRTALRARYRALLAELAARGIVDEVPGRTTGEYLAEVRTGAPAATAPFTVATDLFVLAWYGNEPTGAAQDEQFRDLSRRVVDALRAPVPA